MKNIVALLLCVFMASACFGKAQIVNPGFEDVSTNPDTERLEPDNWTNYTQSGATVYFASKDDFVNSGSRSYKVAARQGYGMTYQEIVSGFSVGETYSFWLYGKGDTNGTWQMDEPGDKIDVFVKFKDSLGVQIGQEKSMVLFDADPETSAPILDPEEWLKSPVFRFMVPEQTASIMIKIRSVDGSVDGNNADGTAIYMDDISLDILPLPAQNPTPANEDTEQASSGLTLSWEPGDDPYVPGTPDSDVTGYYLYMDVYDIANDPGEPNYPGLEPIAVSATEYPAEGMDLGYDKIVYWKIDESINGSAADSSDTAAGNWWTFYTESSFPEIVTQPQDVSVVEGENAVITIAAEGNANPITKYEWFNDDDEIVASGADLSTLSFESVSIRDAGAYYCLLTNTQGKQTTSEVAVLTVKGTLLKYDFENNLTDAAGNFDGTADNIDPNAAGMLSYGAGIDGSAVIFDGKNFSNLGETAYPNVNQGLKSGTLVCWVKKDNSDTGTVISAYNDGLTTCYNLSLQAGERIYFSIRSEGDKSTTVQATATGLFDGQWHQVVVTYAAGSNTVVYYDGEDIGSTTGLGENEVFADWMYPMVIGAGNTRGQISNPYTGMVDGFVLYNYPMTNKEVLDMYNAFAAEEKSLCLDSYASAFDLAGPEGTGSEYADCKIDMYDFAAMAAAWLDCGLYPACSN